MLALRVGACAFFVVACSGERARVVEPAPIAVVAAESSAPAVRSIRPPPSTDRLEVFVAEETHDDPCGWLDPNALPAEVSIDPRPLLPTRGPTWSTCVVTSKNKKPFDDARAKAFIAAFHAPSGRHVIYDEWDDENLVVLGEPIVDRNDIRGATRLPLRTTQSIGSRGAATTITLLEVELDLGASARDRLSAWFAVHADSDLRVVNGARILPATLQRIDGAPARFVLVFIDSSSSLVEQNVRSLLAKLSGR